MDYKNYKCFVCGEKFSDKDDIVVCPDCATPYHRECYKKSNKCTNTELHEKKETYSQEEKPSADDTVVICKKCSSVNKASNKFCENCGESLVQNNNIAEEKTNLHENDDFSEKLNFLFDSEFTDINLNQLDGIDVKEIARFIDKNIFYYLNIFSRNKKSGRNISFNLLCFFVPYYYFANRKMYFWAFISFLTITLLSIPELMQLTVSQLSYLNSSFLESGLYNAFFNTCSFLLIIFRAVIALSANNLYYKHIVKSIRNIKATAPQNKWDDMIAHKGGTCFPAVLVTVVIELAVSFALMIMLSVFILLFL